MRDPYTEKAKRRPASKEAAEAQHEEHLGSKVMKKARAKLGETHKRVRAALNRIGSW